MAVTLRSKLRAAKSRLVRMARHRRSSDARMHESSLVPVGCPRVPLDLHADGRNFARPEDCKPARSTRLEPRYHCETIGYLLLCIWHIVKLIERGDKIAMFLTLSELRVFGRETEGDGRRYEGGAWLRGRNEDEEGEREKKRKEKSEDRESEIRVRVYRTAYRQIERHRDRHRHREQGVFVPLSVQSPEDRYGTTRTFYLLRSSPIRARIRSSGNR